MRDGDPFRSIRRWLLFLAGAAVALAATKDFWFPRHASRAWHEAWVSREIPELSPRREILQEHERLVARMRKDYEERIRREKELYQRQALEYARLRPEKSSP